MKCETSYYFVQRTLHPIKSSASVTETSNPANIYLFKVNNRNTKKKFEINSKL